MRDPPVSRCFPRRARLSVRSLRVAATRCAHAVGPRVPRRRPDNRPLPRLARCRPLLSEAAPRCPLPMPTGRSRRLHTGRRRAARARASSMPPSPSKSWCRRLRRATVPFVRRRPRVGEARRAFPRAASRAPVKSSPRRRALAPASLTRGAQAGRAGTVQLGHARIRPSDS
jgi:hypothetical protein